MELPRLCPLNTSCARNFVREQKCAAKKRCSSSFTLSAFSHNPDAAQPVPLSATSAAGISPVNDCRTHAAWIHHRHVTNHRVAGGEIAEQKQTYVCKTHILPYIPAISLLGTTTDGGRVCTLLYTKSSCVHTLCVTELFK